MRSTEQAFWRDVFLTWLQNCSQQTIGMWTSYSHHLLMCMPSGCLRLRFIITCNLPRHFNWSGYHTDIDRCKFHHDAGRSLRTLYYESRTRRQETWPFFRHGRAHLRCYVEYATSVLGPRTHIATISKWNPVAYCVNFYNNVAMANTIIWLRKTCHPFVMIFWSVRCALALWLDRIHTPY